mmetsp:Transcript_2822/g.8432  ORF Transcript_2822/g.8432 Transcript_2822/m.8432 type:complete len:120 (+) Transcript_2822:264-623(+)
MLEGTGRFYELRFNSRFYEGQGRRVSATAWQYAGVQRCESGGPEPGRVHRAVVCVVPRLLLHSATAFLCCRVLFAALPVFGIRRFPRACGTALVSHLIEDGGRWEGCGGGGLFLDVMLL